MKSNKISALSKQALNNYEHEFIPTPTYAFKEGDKVSVGNLKDAKIVMGLLDNKYYIVEYSVIPKTGAMFRDMNVFEWTRVRPIQPENTESLIKADKDIIIHYSNSPVETLFSFAYGFGLNDRPVYQRDYIWDMEDKVRLIDSIFRGVDIGKFVFVENEDNLDKGYEILDGKQRIRAILDYYENKFAYNGKYFNDLCKDDQRYFKSFTICIGSMRGCSLEQKLRAFILLNTTGKQVDTAQIDKVKALYEEEIGVNFDTGERVNDIERE